MNRYVNALLFVVVLSSIGCTPKPVVVPQTVDASAIETKIGEAFGSVERDADGNIIGVNLAKERASATDDIVRAALELPKLKRFRLAGGSVQSETLDSLASHESLEELFLQDVPLRDAGLQRIVESLPRLKRLALRRLPNISDTGIATLVGSTALRNLALIEMDVTGKSLETVTAMKRLMALDVRTCGCLAAADYRKLSALGNLIDLKIGGFAVDDAVLDAIAPLGNLSGLTIDDSMVTPEGFDRFLATFASAAKLETLVLNRNTAILDDALIPLRKLARLKRLTVCDMMLTGAFLEKIAGDESTRPKLERLSLRKTFLSQECAVALQQYPELRALDISGIAATPELVAVLAELPALEELDATDCGLDDESAALLRKRESLKRFQY